MNNQTVHAEWGGATYHALLNSYGIAVIAHDAMPVGDPEHHEIAQFENEGGAVNG